MGYTSRYGVLCIYVKHAHRVTIYCTAMTYLATQTSAFVAHVVGPLENKIDRVK
jgi:hypothetical protein